MKKNEESDKSNTQERYKKRISDEVIMIARNKRNDYDDKVNNDGVQGRIEVERKEKTRQKLAKKMPQHQIYQNMGVI